jgi:catechol 2,3-dioxygenase-like lactoylglutathione lyase family enzyme
MSETTPYDPCGHIKLAVSDYQKSYLFYKGIFEKLGYKQISNKDGHSGWASPDGYAILIAQAKITNHQYKFDTPGLHHLCLKANSIELVDQIYQSLLLNDTYIFDAPQKYPNYTYKYYAVYFADPDGIKLEVAYY